jgi:ADP-heptose:LPS heptosyltransferase
MCQNEGVSQKGPYLVRNPCLYLYLKIMDALAILLSKCTKTSCQRMQPKKILVINWAHKGDVIIATAVLPMLRRKYPEATLGMLVGAWSQEVIEGHPLIEKIHIFDHPKINRNKQQVFKQLINAVKQFYCVTKEIRQVHYDLAVDVYCYYPNSHFLTWYVKIPWRIGYSSGGGAPFLTQSLAWIYKKQHMSLYHLDLLRTLGIDSDERDYLKSSLLPITEELYVLLQTRFELNNPYIIFHPYSGNPHKDWYQEGWSALIRAFEQSSYSLVFTGGSLQERNCIGSMIHEKKKCINLANVVSFRELAVVVKHAVAIVCVDTMIGHLAAAYDVPSVVLFSRASNVEHWKPSSPYSAVVSNQDMRAAHCRKDSCIENGVHVSVQRVIQELKELAIL